MPTLHQTTIKATLPQDALQAIDNTDRFALLNGENTVEIRDDEVQIEVVAAEIPTSPFKAQTTAVPPVTVTTAISFPTKMDIIKQFTLNSQQNHNRLGSADNQLLMCVPCCGGTGKSKLIRAITKYFQLTKRDKMLRKLAPTSIAAAEIDGLTIHSFLGESRKNSKKKQTRTFRPGDTNLSARLNRIVKTAKHINSEIPFGDAPILVFRNTFRTQINNRAVLNKAMEMGLRPMVCVAQDYFQEKIIGDLRLPKTFLGLPDNKTEHLPGYLPLVSGMPVLLTENMATELELSGGTRGIFHQLVYEESSVDIQFQDKNFPTNTNPVEVASVYVPLSRVKRLDDLLIIRPFEFTALQVKPSTAQREELKRLDRIAKSIPKCFPISM
ncbi:unnamed protein product [Rotaria magnacalcarata]